MLAEKTAITKLYLHFGPASQGVLQNRNSVIFSGKHGLMRVPGPSVWIDWLVDLEYM